jgi:hypothetical protein
VQGWLRFTQDKKIRVLNDKGVVYETKTDHIPACIYPFHELAYNFAPKKEGNVKQYVVGMSNGDIKCYRMNQFDASVSWSITAVKSKSEPLFIRIFNLSGGKRSELIVARQDSQIEVYSCKENTANNLEFELIAWIDTTEAITGLEGCFFGAEQKPQMFFSCFSGKILGLTLQNEYRAGQDQSVQGKTEMARQIQGLKAEVEELEKRVANARSINETMGSVRVES